MDKKTKKLQGTIQVLDLAESLAIMKDIKNIQKDSINKSQNKLMSDISRKTRKATKKK